MDLRSSPKALDLQSRVNLVFGLITILLLFLGSGIVSHINTRTLSLSAEQITHTHETLLALNDLLSLAKDAETGQRGYVITGDARYLDPFNKSVAQIADRLKDVERMTDQLPEHQSHITNLKSALASKIQELQETITLRRDQGFDAARAVVVTDRGKAAMDIIRSEVAAMQQSESDRRVQRIEAMDRAYAVAVTSGVIAVVVGIVLTFVVTFLIRRAILHRRWEDWLQSGQIGLSKVMVGDQILDRLGENIVLFLAQSLNAQTGAFFSSVDQHRFRRTATFGVPAGSRVLNQFDLHDGLLGQACKSNRPYLLRDVPEGYLAVGSAFGNSKPRNLLIIPFAADDVVNSVVELGFLREFDESTMEFFDRISGSVGVAVRSANDRNHLQNLLEETQRQAEELQSQGEELRVANEELEEQSRTLKESQTRLELQQVELEQTNTQLEEQTVHLEHQRDEVVKAKTELETQAKELERASQVKSDFLANMSHELRTPLNSSLILAKLLADNSNGNLTAEQIQYAETIRNSGNDLLDLINDILDLSKIESGHMEIRPEEFTLQNLIDGLCRTFQPLADQKGLTFRTVIAPGNPTILNTDWQRLEQVLKNILSNAMKFTEKGEVAVNVSLAPNGQIAFAVSDTGIGIPAHQHEMIFEAFRQADGTTNRKYGGTGLGLSISRELIRRLGGEIFLTSEMGRGSLFTVTVPKIYRAQSAGSMTLETSLSSERDSLTVAPSAPLESRDSRGVVDDRSVLSGTKRIILVVEDDRSFIQILQDLIHELGFQCLIAMSAEEGFAVAVQYLPNAVVLDVGLPDHSGLWVLDRLKHDARTRHIPVHIVSAGDFGKTALSLGAIGYMPKPVKREELAKALEQLEDRLEQRMRRVLVVEDDPVQLDSLQKLLRSREVETVGAQNGTECLACLKESTFDCMVLDLSLPDSSGYALLETLSREDAYSFPPVIVYTGRELSEDEEQQLRRYSKSIIIKGAKSPERLLDEVTLFLHQVVAKLPPEQQRMIQKSMNRDLVIEGRRILIVEDDVRNIFALTSILEPQGATLSIARNGREALELLDRSSQHPDQPIDLVLMDVMMPEMDGITATREIRKRPEWKKLPIIVLTAKAMPDDQERCLATGANDYMAKPLDVEKLLSLVRVWMPR